jgi:hypothetical protein
MNTTIGRGHTSLGSFLSYEISCLPSLVEESAALLMKKQATTPILRNFRIYELRCSVVASDEPASLSIWFRMFITFSTDGRVLECASRGLHRLQAMSKLPFWKTRPVYYLQGIILISASQHFSVPSE